MGTTGQSITLANSIIGVGILAMPFCFQQCGVLLATLILLIMGLTSRLCCYFLLKSALLARRRTFEFLAFHVFGPAGKMAVEVGIIGFLMGTCIAYFVVVGDLGPQIIAKMFNINQSDILRTSIMVIVSLVCVLPLGLLRNVDSLSNVSAATIGFYFCLVIKVIADAASELMTGEWQSRVHMWRPAGLLQCVPIFSMALFCQTQLFEIFESLPTLSLEKMNVVTKNAINICTSVYFTLGVFGYIAFSSQDISGNILMSLSPTMGSDVIKLGFVMSLAFSFPLIIFPCRASLYSFLYKKVHSSHHDHIINHSIPEMTFRCITVAIIAVALFISLLIPNIELVLGLVGSTIGVLICLVFPAACFVNVTFKNTNERVLAKGVIVLGLIIMVLGTYANLQAAENQMDRYDEKFITQERIDKIVEDFFEKQDKPDVYLKPAVKNEPIPENHNIINSNKINKNIIKDSEVQPPNPIPPESNEKAPEKIVDELKLEEKKLVVIPADRQTPEKVADSHPKDLKTKLEAKLANGDTLNVREDVEKIKEVKPKSQETKIDVKQQKLMETIKQHGEEQKEILDEIIKTKKELQQNKKEADSNEAKKIAVESIKQIANIAIQSLGGVTEKPNQVNNDKKSERLEKLTNEAVQEIAKKAFETIEAIQEIKENPEAPVPNSENQVKVEVPVRKSENQVNVEVPVPKSENQVNAEIPKVKETVKKSNEDVKDIKQNLGAPESKLENPANPEVSKTKTSDGSKVDPVQNNIQTNQVVQSLPVNVPIVQALSKQESANEKRETQENVVDNVVPQGKPVAQQIANQNAQIAIHNNIVQKHPELSNPVHDAPNEFKTHSHSPDEPKSYKRGEDTQVRNPPQESNIVNLDKAKDIAQPNKDPAAVKNVDKPKDALAKPNVEINDIQVNKVQSNGANIQTNENPVLERRKREADDCTKKINSKPDDLEEYLPRNIDINSVALPKDLPLDANMFHHLSRSLKNYDKDER